MVHQTATDHALPRSASRGDRAQRLAFVVPPLLALVVLLISVRTPVGPSAAITVAPSFDGPRAAEFARMLAERTPDRSPGSLTGHQAADAVAGSLSEASGEPVHRAVFSATGPRGADVPMENLWVLEKGPSREVVVVTANRDDVAPGPGLDDNGSGTAALVELARDLYGVERAGGLVVASTDGGTVGQAGNLELLRSLRAAGLSPVAVVSLDAIGGPTGSLPVLFQGTGGVRTPEVLLKGLEESLASQPASGDSGPPSAIAQVLDLIAPAAPRGAQVPFLDAGVAAIQLGDGGGGAGVEAIDDARLGAVGSAIGTLLVRLDAEPRPAPPSSAYIAVSGRVIPGRAVALLALALLVGPLVAVGRRLLRERARRGGWRTALLVALAGAIPGVVAVLAARAAGLAGAIDTPPGAGWPQADGLAVAAVVLAAAAAVAGAAWFARRRWHAGVPVVAAPLIGLAACVLLIAGSPASALLAVPALWLWTLSRRPEPPLPRALWAAAPVVGVGLLVFLLRGASLPDLVGAAGTGALPAGLVVGSAVLLGAAALAAVGEEG